MSLPARLGRVVVLGLVIGVGLADSGHGEEGELLYERQTQFGVVQVIDYTPAGTAALRLLRCGNSIVGAEWADRTEYGGQSAFLNFAIHQAVVFLKPQPKRVLQLGLGAGTVPSSLREAGIVVDTVELNPAVVEAAGRFFGYNAQDQGNVEGTTHIMDAAVYLEGPPPLPTKRYDVVFSDLFTGSNAGWDSEQKVLANVQAHWLRPRGLLLLNFFGYHDPNVGGAAATQFSRTRAVFVALKQTFGTVRCFREIPFDLAPDSPANLIFLASDDTDLLLSPQPFAVPTEGDWHNPPPLTSFWVQKHFTEFEFTAELSKPASKEEFDAEVMRASAMKANAAYRRLLADIYPPSSTWAVEGSNNFVVPVKEEL